MREDAMRAPTFLRDPYRRRLETRVLACREAPGGFLAITPDTLLFPEGGGQPADRGTLGGLAVGAVHADADHGWIHELPAALPPGPVEIELDWERRFDHMQQHSAQHLITALAQDHYALATTAFHLGPDRSSIDLDAAALDPGLLVELRALVDSEIRRAVRVSARWVRADELPDLGVRSRGLPEGHQGPVRVVSIAGIDRNTCGGTHVANTAELQLVSFLGTERVHGGTRLHYAAGGRALRLLDTALERERGLTHLLACGAGEHAHAVERLLQEQREAGRQLRGLREELAGALGEGLARGVEAGLGRLHREQDDLPFLQAVAGVACRLAPGALLLLTGGQPEGCFLLAGPPEPVARLGPRLCTALEARGGGARGRFQGRALRNDRREAAAEVLRAGLSDPTP